jgi:nitrogen-specific signal transduction histidine kinase
VNLNQYILVCSNDDEALRRISAAMSNGMKLVRAATWIEAERHMTLYAPVAVVLDVRCDDMYQRVDEWLQQFSDVPLIAMGRPRSDRILYLDRFDIFAYADHDDDYQEWQKLIRLAAKHHTMRVDATQWKERAMTPVTPPAPAETAAPARKETPSIISHVAAAFRHFEHVDLMLDRAVEGLAAASHSTRTGLFARDETKGSYRLRAGLKYLRETAEVVYEANDPLVRWFERHAHMITRTLAGQLPDPAQRQLLLRNLDLAGAEIMAPLHARGQLLGWFFIGYRSTGQPYNVSDLEEISMAADYLSMLLENALLYREVTVQKSLAETLLHSLPTGIIAVDDGGMVRWFSTAAEKLFDRRAADVVGKPIETLGSRITDAVRRALNGEPPPAQRLWEEPASRRFVQVDVQRLGGSAEKMGAVVMIQDETAVRHLKEKQEQVERAAFWTDLAAGLSHEIRNPLVTISTFAQLLPERYQDEEFREEFSKMVTGEVGRLDGIINQINDFAHPPEPVHARVDVRGPLQQALRKVFPESPSRLVRVKSQLDGNLPLVRGDERALTDCFAHIFQNAFEALQGKTDATLTYSAHTATGPGNERLVEVSISDNGCGIPEESREKLFSPFFTTKARGMGLGLPIVKRTVIDHNGRVSVDSNGRGTSVVIQLPAVDQTMNGNAA